MWRNLELRTLRGRLATLDENAGVVRAMAALRKADSPEFDPAPLIKRAAEVFAQSRKSGQPPEAVALQEEILALPASALKQLAKAAAADAALAVEMRTGIAMIAVMAMSESSPAEAVPLMVSLPLTDGIWQNQMMKMLSNWTRSDPASATAWLKAALAGGRFAALSEQSRFHLEFIAANGSVMQNPIGELPSIRSAPVKTQNGLLETGAKHLKTPEERRVFTAAVVSWPEAAIRERKLGPLFLPMLESESFPPVAAWLEALPDVSDTDRIRARFILATAQPMSPEMSARADWLLEHSEATARPDIAAELMKTWIRHDYNAAGAWLNANKTASWRDTAVHAFATGIAKTEPATAFDWGATIADSELCRSALDSIYPAWHRQDAGAAEAALEKSTLPGELKTSLKSAGAPPHH
jgi:hypothetical protein